MPFEKLGVGGERVEGMAIVKLHVVIEDVVAA